jgi:hypothetical protein
MRSLPSTDSEVDPDPNSSSIDLWPGKSPINLRTRQNPCLLGLTKVDQSTADSPATPQQSHDPAPSLVVSDHGGNNIS